MTENQPTNVTPLRPTTTSGAPGPTQPDLPHPPPTSPPETASERRLDGRRAVRLLRAKVAELEHYVLTIGDASDIMTSAIADLALVADLLANHVEDTENRLVLLESHTENLIERVFEIEERRDEP